MNKEKAGREPELNTHATLRLKDKDLRKSEGRGVGHRNEPSQGGRNYNARRVEARIGPQSGLTESRELNTGSLNTYKGIVGTKEGGERLSTTLMNLTS